MSALGMAWFKVLKRMRERNALAPIPPTQGDAIGEGPWWYCQGSGSDLCGAKNYHDEKVCWKCHRPKLAPSPNAQSELVATPRTDAEERACVRLSGEPGFVTVEHARDLERELNKAATRITELEQRNRELEHGLHEVGEQLELGDVLEAELTKRAEAAEASVKLLEANRMACPYCNPITGAARSKDEPA